MEPATDELKLALMSLFGYDFLYIELEFVESIDDDEPIRDCRKSFLLPQFGDALFVLTEYRSIIEAFYNFIYHNLVSQKNKNYIKTLNVHLSSLFSLFGASYIFNIFFFCIRIVRLS